LTLDRVLDDARFETGGSVHPKRPAAQGPPLGHLVGSSRYVRIVNVAACSPSIAQYVHVQFTPGVHAPPRLAQYWGRRHESEIGLPPVRVQATGFASYS
jgi:hypothetical protein